MYVPERSKERAVGGWEMVVCTEGYTNIIRRIDALVTGTNHCAIVGRNPVALGTQSYMSSFLPSDVNDLCPFPVVLTARSSREVLTLDDRYLLQI